MSHPRMRFSTFLVLWLLTLPAALGAVIPVDQGLLNPTVAYTINTGPGDQFDAHVDGNIASHTSGGEVRYYDFLTGLDVPVPGPANTSGRLSGVDAGKIVFSREDDLGKTTIVVPTVGTQFQFSGFMQPVDAYPTFDVMKAGAAAPVKFSLGGFRGTNIFAPGYPKSQAINCGSSVSESTLEQTTTAGASSLTYDATTDIYTYIWKTDRSWAGTCRQLAIQFTDLSALRQLQIQVRARCVRLLQSGC